MNRLALVAPLFALTLALGTTVSPETALAVDPWVDTGFSPVTPAPDADVVVVRERFHGATGLDLTDYGIAGGPHTYVQSLYFRLFANASVSSPEAFSGLIVLPDSVTILGIITDEDYLGGSSDDGLFTASDSLFGVGLDPDRYSEHARGFDTGAVNSSNEFIGFVHSNTVAFGLNVTSGVDDFRIIIDYGDAFVPGLSFDILAVDVGSLGGVVPFAGIQVGNIDSLTVFGSGDFGETPSLTRIPLTSTDPPVVGEALPFLPGESLFIARDTSGLTNIDSFDTSLEVPLPGMFQLNSTVSNPRGITDHENGLLYCVGRDGGFGIMDPDSRNVSTTLMANLSGNVVDVTNLPGDDDVFGIRNTSGNSRVDRIDPSVPVVTASWDIVGPDTPVAIADGASGLLYVLGQSGVLGWCNSAGGDSGFVDLSPPTGSYDGLTGKPGTQLLYLLRNTSGDTKVDIYDIVTGMVTFDVASLSVPTSPSDITDGPNDLLYVIGDGGSNPTAFTAVDPVTGNVLALFGILDFNGVYRTLTGYEPSVTGVPGRGGARTTLLRHLAWPNPFSSSQVEIRFQTEQPAPVRVRIVDVRGRLLRDLHQGLEAGGWHTLRWDGRDDAGRTLPAGNYFYHITAGGQVASGKLVMVR